MTYHVAEASSNLYRGIVETVSELCPSLVKTCRNSTEPLSNLTSCFRPCATRLHLASALGYGLGHGRNFAHGHTHDLWPRPLATACHPHALLAPAHAHAQGPWPRAMTWPMALTFDHARDQRHGPWPRLMTMAHGAWAIAMNHGLGPWP